MGGMVSVRSVASGRAPPAQSRRYEPSALDSKAAACGRVAGNCGRRQPPEGLAHPDIKSPHGTPRVESVEHYLCRGDGNLRQPEHNAHLLDELATVYTLTHDDIVLPVCHGSGPLRLPSSARAQREKQNPKDSSLVTRHTVCWPSCLRFAAYACCGRA
jgi:hypothetical protein